MSEVIARPSSCVEVRTSEARGRGVFAIRTIDEGVVVEECPVIVVASNEIEALHNTPLRDYSFEWGPTGDEAAIALGFGSLYNHSNDPNAVYVRRLDARILFFVSLRKINKGEEITVNYHGGFGDKRRVWFEAR